MSDIHERAKREVAIASEQDARLVYRFLKGDDITEIQYRLIRLIMESDPSEQQEQIIRAVLG